MRNRAARGFRGPGVKQKELAPCKQKFLASMPFRLAQNLFENISVISCNSLKHFTIFKFSFALLIKSILKMELITLLV